MHIMSNIIIMYTDVYKTTMRKSLKYMETQPSKYIGYGREMNLVG